MSFGEKSYTHHFEGKKQDELYIVESLMNVDFRKEYTLPVICVLRKKKGNIRPAEMSVSHSVE